MAKPNKEAENAETEEEKAIGNLQYALDKACHYIHDAQTASFSYRALQAIRRGVDPKTVQKGLKALQAALKDAEQAVKDAVENPEEATVDHSRVRLTD